jgi:hypothetical protein
MHTFLYAVFFNNYQSAKNAMRVYQAKLLSAGISYTTNSASMTVFTEDGDDRCKIMFCKAQTLQDLERLRGLSIAAYIYSDDFKPTPEVEAYIHSRVQYRANEESN